MRVALNKVGATAHRDNWKFIDYPLSVLTDTNFLIIENQKFIMQKRILSSKKATK